MISYDEMMKKIDKRVLKVFDEHLCMYSIMGKDNMEEANKYLIEKAKTTLHTRIETNLHMIKYATSKEHPNLEYEMYLKHDLELLKELL